MMKKQKRSKLFISDDVVFEILSWLPPESLLRFRSVCKSWYSTISHSDFIAKHQSHFGNYSLLQNKNNSCFLAIVVAHGKSLQLRQISERNCREHTLLSEYNLADTFFSHYKIMACCNGVFCYASLINNDDDARIFLCNPSIRWTRTVPPFPFYTNEQENNNPQIYNYGVGFDRRSNDYKVIMLSRGATDNLCVSSRRPRQAALYSVKFNSWTRVKNVPGPPFSPNGVSIFLHGFIHWLSYTTCMYENKRIVLFDVSNRVFGEMQLPAGNVDDAVVRRSNYTHGISISVVRGSLCFLVSSDSETCDVNTVCCHVWMMKEYGVAESWSKQHVIEFKMVIERQQLVSPAFRLIIVSTQASVGGKIMLSLCGNDFPSNLALFDPETAECIDLGRSQHSCRDVVSLVPSLELLDVIM